MRFLIVIICACAAGFGQLLAADEPVRLLTYTDYAPYVSDKVPEGGMLTEVIKTAYAEQGVELEVVYVPWKRGYRMVQEGEAIGTFSWQRTKDRERDFLLSDALFADSNLIFTTLADFKQIEDLRSRHKRGETSIICIPLGWTIPARFKALVEEKIVARVAPEKIGSCLELMHGGRAHILNIPPLTVYFEMNALAERLSVERDVIPGFRVVDFDPGPLATTHILFARTKEGAAAAAIFKKGFQAILANGQYSKIIKQHLALYPGMGREQVLKDLKEIGLLPAAP